MRQVILEDEEARLTGGDDGKLRLYEREKDAFGTLYWSRVTDDEAAFEVLARLVERTAADHAGTAEET